MSLVTEIIAGYCRFICKCMCILFMWNCSFVSYELSYEEERISARSNIISSLFSCLCAWKKKLSAGCLEGQSNLGDVFGAVCQQISFVADFAGNAEIDILVWCSIVSNATQHL